MEQDPFSAKMSSSLSKLQPSGRIPASYPTGAALS